MEGDEDAIAIASSSDEEEKDLKKEEKKPKKTRSRRKRCVLVCGELDFKITSPLTCTGHSPSMYLTASTTVVGAGWVRTGTVTIPVSLWAYSESSGKEVWLEACRRRG